MYYNLERQTMICHLHYENRLDTMKLDIDIKITEACLDTMKLEIYIK